ncbi:Bromodomain-containing protein 1 [Liparis tanakae]|uniref:Bromodomain-containing protein 1 n=1 Tax=Liparis tanakae TaxID=230148 RepID=A0A4Z2FQV2_9TELE|nr:Bromodomain-containing protein 1 [Liparis tanakae]
MTHDALAQPHCCWGKTLRAELRCSTDGPQSSSRPVTGTDTLNKPLNRPAPVALDTRHRPRAQSHPGRAAAIAAVSTRGIRENIPPRAARTSLTAARARSHRDPVRAGVREGRRPPFTSGFLLCWSPSFLPFAVTTGADVQPVDGGARRGSPDSGRAAAPSRRTPGGHRGEGGSATDPRSALHGGAMKKKSRPHRPAALKRDSSPIKPSANRETLTYAQAQRIVELEVDGRVHRLSIYDKMEVVGDDDPTAQEITECNSNKENSDKPQQVLVRSARLKNSQQKKNAALVATAAAAVATGPAHAGGGARLPEPRVRTVEYNLPVVPRRPAAYYRYAARTAEELDEEVEYDMDEEDYAWLELLNERRRSEGVSQASSNLFEFLVDRFEKEAHAAARGRADPRPPVDEDAVCCVCMDGDGADSNVILFCDACNIAVHQECYGVPHVPEGQWLCRHCLQRPARPAACVFCPNRGGALKRTDDERWGHVACALWVPEVGFSDAVFVEPIDGVRDIPAARWKLTCYLCKEKGVGACIQCDRAHCYSAFHVSCAQRAGLYMKMEPVKEAAPGGGASFSVKKTAYCCGHTPEGCDRRPLAVYDEPRLKSGAACLKRPDKRGKARAKGWAKRKSRRGEPEPAPPEAPGNAAGPSITASSFASILNQVAVQRKRVFVERVLSYWVQKRRSRTNVPLIRRLQANPTPPKVKPMVGGARWGRSLVLRSPWTNGLVCSRQNRVEANQALKEQLKELPPLIQNTVAGDVKKLCNHDDHDDNHDDHDDHDDATS